MRVFGSSIEDDGLHAADMLIGFRHVTLVFEVLHTADAAKDELCLLLFGEIDRQAIVDSHFDARFVRKNLTNGFLALTDGESLFLCAVAADADDNLVLQFQATLHDIVVAQGKRVE